jgi:hypothetical protein
MKVSLQSYGGFAAIFPQPGREVDAAALPPDAAAELARLVDAARRESGGPPPRVLPDAISYSITVAEGGRSTVLEGSDGTMSPAFAALLDWLRSNAQER